MSSLKVKKMLVALLFVLSIPLTCGGICDDTTPETPTTNQTTVISTNTGGDYRRCASLTCTYKVKLTKDIKTAINGVRINVATAVPLGGKWE